MEYDMEYELNKIKNNRPSDNKIFLELQNVCKSAEYDNLYKLDSHLYLEIRHLCKSICVDSDAGISALGEHIDNLWRMFLDNLKPLYRQTVSHNRAMVKLVRCRRFFIAKTVRAIKSRDWVVKHNLEHDRASGLDICSYIHKYNLTWNRFTEWFDGESYHITGYVYGHIPMPNNIVLNLRAEFPSLSSQMAQMIGEVLHKHNKYQPVQIREMQILGLGNDFIEAVLIHWYKFSNDFDDISNRKFEKLLENHIIKIQQNLAEISDKWIGYKFKRHLGDIMIIEDINNDKIYIKCRKKLSEISEGKLISTQWIPDKHGLIWERRLTKRSREFVLTLFKIK